MRQSGQRTSEGKRKRKKKKKNRKTFSPGKMRSSFTDIVGGVWCIGVKPNAFLARDSWREEGNTHIFQAPHLQFATQALLRERVSSSAALKAFLFFFAVISQKERHRELSAMLFHKYDSEPLAKTLRVSLPQGQRAVYWAERVKWLLVSGDSFNKHVQRNEARTSWWSEIKSGVDVGD